MKVLISYRLTILLDVETEVARFVTEPNGERWSLLQRRVLRKLARVCHDPQVCDCEAEYDVCASLPCSFGCC